MQMASLPTGQYVIIFCPVNMMQPGNTVYFCTLQLRNSDCDITVTINKHTNRLVTGGTVEQW